MMEHSATQDLDNQSCFGIFRQLSKVMESLATRQTVSEVATVVKEWNQSLQKLQNTLEHWPGADLTREAQLDTIQQKEKDVEQKRNYLYQLRQEIEMLQNGYTLSVPPENQDTNRVPTP